MIFRKAEMRDAGAIFGIIENAKRYLKAHGVWQWQEGYPAMSDITSDIEKGMAYILDDNGTVAAAVSISFEKEAYFDTLEGGRWLEAEWSAAFHRIAVSPEYRGTGTADELVREVGRECGRLGASNIRVDTHPKNGAMQALVERCGYVKCGIVTLQNVKKDPSRVAYQIVIDKFS